MKVVKFSIILFTFFLIISCNQDKIDQLEYRLRKCKLELKSSENDLEDALNAISRIENKVSDIEIAVKNLNENILYGNPDYYYNYVTKIIESSVEIEDSLEELKNEFY